MRVTILNNFLQSQFNQNSPRISLKQKRLTLSHNAKTNCHKPKIGIQKPYFTPSATMLLQEIKGIGFQKPLHKPLQFYTILRNFQLFVAISEQTVKSPVQRNQLQKPSKPSLTWPAQKLRQPSKPKNWLKEASKAPAFSHNGLHNGFAYAAQWFNIDAQSWTMS